MRTRRSLSTISVLCFVLAAPWGARADEVVAQRLYDLGGRLEVMLTPSMSTFDKYTRHVAASVGLAYYFNDYIGLEIDLGYAFLHGDRKLLNEILNTAESLNPIERLPLSDLKYMDFWTSGGLVFNPLYGKINLSAELAINFHFYLVAGAGTAQYKYHELRWSGSGPAATFEKKEVTAGFKPMFYYGGGLRFHIVEDWSLRIEVRDQVYYDEYKAEHKPSGTTVAEKTIEDFVHITMVRLGVCYSFF
ncbi:MAG: outer membrane beta-barrel domain-containing protein [Deltaproteobacteria bacterium]|nr:outer membrane beta-barrel domain-containing protein [Deltaproteobacteria bacterium]